MTARILAFPDVPTPCQILREAVDAFAAAAVTSVVPSPLVRACQRGDGRPEVFTVGGQTVIATVTGGRMEPDAIVQAWRTLRALAPAAESRVRISGGRVLVCPPHLGGAA